jgi:predicted TPR repeat methyltransferase
MAEPTRDAGISPDIAANIDPSAVSDRLKSMTAGEVLQAAIRLHKAGEFRDARVLYVRLNEVLPDYAAPWNFRGLAEYQLGDMKAGIELIRKSLALAPNYPDAHSNLGSILLVAEEHEQAEFHLREAVRLAPDASPPRVALGLLLRAREEFLESEQEFHTALKLDPNSAPAHHGLGRTLSSMSRHAEALECYQRALAIAPALAGARRLVAMSLCYMGEAERGKAHLNEWLEEEPDNAEAMHMLAAVGGTAPPPRASDRYVKTLFDNFAASFDAKLAALEYRAPELIAAQLRECVDPDGKFDLLDAGCGTGLLGQKVRELCRTLDGVDLSSEMLARARARKVYDALDEGELTAHLRSKAPAAYDVVTIADTLCYFGDLENVAQAGYAALRPGGWLLLTVEHDVSGVAGESGHHMQVNGRYVHRRDYVERCLRAAGFAELRVSENVLRQEGGKPVHGLVVAARRSAA